MERAVPFDTQAERATLGAILLDREAIIAVADWLTPDHFYLEKHGWIYAAVLACYNRRVPPDIATISDDLRRHERLEPVGGIAFLGELVAEVPTAVHIEYYAAIVERTAVRRRLIETGGKIAALGYAEHDDLQQTLDQAESALFAVSDQRTTSTVYSLGSVVNDLFRAMSYQQEHRGEVSGVPSGYDRLDALTGGFQPTDSIILAARPSNGKTSLALSMAYNAAMRQQTRTGIFSLEMGREQLGQRMLALHTGIDLQRIRFGNVHGAELARMTRAMGELSDLPIFIEDAAALSIHDLRARARRMHARQGLDMLIIDYLQLLSGTKASAQSNRNTEITQISQGIKALARELHIPVVTLSQLSRAVEGRASHVPMLSDLRDGGAIEQDSDLVMFIYREELYDPETDKPGVAEIHIAKHRNGPLGVVPLHFEKATTKFHNLERTRTSAGS
jgi:replicative DNA helicase